MVDKGIAQKNFKKAAIVNTFLVVFILILFNVIGNLTFSRIDLTAEKRFSLNKNTKELLHQLDDYVFVKVYLHGELPPAYRKLRTEILQMLNEFRAYSKNIQFEFINPSASADQKERNSIYRQLSESGLTYTTPVEQKESGVSQSIIWPGAILSYRTKNVALNFLSSQTYSSEEAMISQSITNLEYSLTNAIRKLSFKLRPRIAFIEGYGMLDSLRTKDISRAFSEYYDVERVRIDSTLSALVYRNTEEDSVRIRPRYRCVIIAKPQEPFKEKDKFMLDQYVMYGGRILWLVDAVHADMDSLSTGNTTLVFPNSHNLDDQLFKYGVRVNPNLVMDLRSASIPVVTGVIANQPRYQPFKWFYFPLSLPNTNHPIVNNLNPVRFEFTSNIDLVGNDKIKKTVLLSSSPRSKLTPAPARVSLNILKEPPSPEDYVSGEIPLAVLLEGNFTSLYKNRPLDPLDQLRNSKIIGFKEEGEFTKMIVVADGDLIKNHYNPVSGKISPLGLDRYTGEIFGNKEFLLNAMNYLCDDSGLISIRSRTVRLRLLDETKVKMNKLSIQLKNVLIPIVIVILLGLIKFTIRKRKYAAQKLK
ncbi:MAG: gliding motility-associated ABC transporter substrate-binding protein GldG [Flavobacteriales bacterium]